MKTIVQFLKDSVGELKKSTWLSRQEVIQSTILVGIVVVLVSAYVGLIDFGLTRVLGAVAGAEGLEPSVPVLETGGLPVNRRSP